MLSAQAEQLRVAAHLLAAEGLATQREPSELDPIQSLVRQLLLQELSNYRADGRFPKNRDFEQRTPVFVDAEGTRCAMAHLLEAGGEAALVSKISLERNNAYVKELADEARLIDWLKAAGLTVEEAAAIQPSYSDVRSDCICGGSSFSQVQYPVPATAVLKAVVDSSKSAAVIVEIYGTSPGPKVGDTVTLQYLNYKVDDQVLIPIGKTTTERTDGGGGNPAIILSAQGTYSCRSQGVTDAPALTSSQFAQAVTSAECGKTLASIDPKWSQSSGGSTPMGCGASVGAGAPTSLGILLALVSVLVARKLR